MVAGATGDLEEALLAWRAVLGDQYVITDDARLAAANAATYATTQRAAGIIEPASVEDIQACLRIANQFHVSVYPISTGKNWGYGSRVPAQDGSVIMALHRMNGILELSEELAYVTVEPGVTMKQLYEFLIAKESRLMVPATGSAPTTSLIGNALERGLVVGPHSDRFGQTCGLEVVLPTGAIVHTGFERFAHARAGKVCEWGVGPAFSGMFSQSSFGVVTKMTFWLNRVPQNFLFCSIGFKDSKDLPRLIDTLRELRLDGILDPGMSCLGLWNDYKLISERLGTYPWEMSGDKTPLPDNLRRDLSRHFGGVSWLGTIMLYCPSRACVRAHRKLLRQYLQHCVDQMHFADDRTTKIPKWLWRPYYWFTGFDVRPVLELDTSPLLGVPNEFGSMITVYWRKKRLLPPNPDPDRDRCGVLWCGPVFPLVGDEVEFGVHTVADCCLKHGFEPSIALLIHGRRKLSLVYGIIYDREVLSDDEHAHQCFEEITETLGARGYFPYRLGVHSMNALPASRDGYPELYEHIKATLDPNHIMAPGRYEH